MEDLLKLPRYELVTQFKCIEGWSQIVHWAGVRMADFIEAHPPALVDGREPKYVYMETPDGDFYNGYDLHVCRHPQTLLVTEMMGAPLTQYHGAPLRLHMPTKYGYKQIKRIGLISYTTASLTTTGRSLVTTGTAVCEIRERTFRGKSKAWTMAHVAYGTGHETDARHLLRTSSLYAFCREHLFRDHTSSRTHLSCVEIMLCRLLVASGFAV